LKLARFPPSLAAARRGFAFCLGDPSSRLPIADCIVDGPQSKKFTPVFL
jgi:hypothetical protein